MKKIAALFILGMMVGESVVNAQTSTQKTPAEKKAIEKRQRSLGGQRNPIEPKSGAAVQENDPTENTAIDENQSREVQDAGVVTPNEDQPTQGTDQTGSSSESKSNTPAVIQPATSESGSPSVLSDRNGQGRDGTGNVQRSSPNIAGSPVPGNMNLSRKDNSEKNINIDPLRIKKQEEQPAANRADNSEARDRASKNTDKKIGKKESDRSKAKNRRNKDKSSGK